MSKSLYWKTAGWSLKIPKDCVSIFALSDITVWAVISSTFRLKAIPSTDFSSTRHLIRHCAVTFLIENSDWWSWMRWNELKSPFEQPSQIGWARNTAVIGIWTIAFFYQILAMMRSLKKLKQKPDTKIQAKEMSFVPIISVHILILSYRPVGWWLNFFQLEHGPHLRPPSSLRTKACQWCVWASIRGIGLLDARDNVSSQSLCASHAYMEPPVYGQTSDRKKV